MQQQQSNSQLKQHQLLQQTQQQQKLPQQLEQSQQQSQPRPQQSQQHQLQLKSQQQQGQQQKQQLQVSQQPPLSLASPSDNPVHKSNMSVDANTSINTSKILTSNASTGSTQTIHPSNNSTLPQTQSLSQNQLLHQQQQQNLQSILLQQYKRQQQQIPSSNQTITNAVTSNPSQSQYIQILQQQNNFQQQLRSNQIPITLTSKNILSDNIKLDNKIPLTPSVFASQLSDISQSLAEVSNKSKIIQDSNNSTTQQLNSQINLQQFNRQQQYIQNNPRYLQLLKQNYQTQHFRANQIPSSVSSVAPITSLPSDTNRSLSYDNSLRISNSSTQLSSLSQPVTNSSPTIPNTLSNSLSNTSVTMSTSNKRNTNVSNKVSTNRSSKSSLNKQINNKEKDKLYYDTLRTGTLDNDDTIMTFNNRKDVITSKLSIIERKSLVGMKGSQPLFARKKIHWDYLMDEMSWMAVDFRQELRLKLSLVQTIAKLVIEPNNKTKNSAISETDDVRKEKKLIASRISHVIKKFWNKFELSRDKLYANVDTHVDNEKISESTYPINPIPLLDHQKDSIIRLQNVINSGNGCAIIGQRCVGKTSMIVAHTDSWINESSKLILIFVSRHSILRWMSEYERILPNRNIRIWLADTSLNLIVSNKSNNVLLCVLEKISDYIDKLSEFGDINGIVIDVRSITQINIKNADIINFSKLIPSTMINRCVVSDDLDHNKLIPWINFLNPLSNEYELEDQDTNEWEKLLTTYANDISKYVVEVNVNSLVESFASAQVREEIFCLDMDSLQHLKYYQVCDYLLGQMSFKGDNPWILAQAVILIRRVCFHEAFVSIRSINNVRRIDNLFNHENSDSSSTGIGLGFGLLNGSLYTGTDGMSFKNEIIPTSDGFSENIKSSYSLKSNNDNITNSNIGKQLNSFMKESFHPQSIGQGLSYPSRNFHVSLAPGPLSSKLSSPARFNMNGNFYDSIGSCKLQSLCGLIGRFTGLRIIVMVSTIDEQLTVHNFLNRLGYLHLFAGISGSKINYNISSNEAKMNLSSWLKAQTVLQRFNRTPLEASALMVVTKDIFTSPGVIPWKADVVIILSDDWISPTDIRSCYRLRLTSAGPSGDPVTVVRVVSKQTIEESIARRGSILNLHGMSINDLFHSMTTSNNNIMLSNIPLEIIKMKVDNTKVFMYSNTISTSNWLQILHLAIQFAEFQLSKVCKYSPFSTILNHPINKTNEFIDICKLYNNESACEEICDLILNHYINIECPYHNNTLLKMLSSKTAFISMSLHAIVLRLIDCQIRNILHNQEVFLDKKLHYNNCENNFNSYQISKLSFEGYGPNAISSTQRFFSSLIQPIITPIQSISNESSMLSATGTGSIVITSGGHGTPMYRAVQLFRNLQSIRKRTTTAIDPILYCLTSLQNYSKYDYKYSYDSNMLDNILQIEYKKKRSVTTDNNLQTLDEVQKNPVILSSTYRIDIPATLKRYDNDNIIREDEKDLYIDKRKKYN